MKKVILPWRKNVMNSKIERIKRLKKKRIWPSILGLVVISSLFAIVLAILVEVSIYDMFKRKTLTNMSQIKPMVDLFEDYENNKESIQEQVNSYIDETSEAEAVWVTDLDGNKIWANSDKKPNFDKKVSLDFLDKNIVHIIIAEEETNIAVNVDGDIVFRDNIFHKMGIANILNNGWSGDKEIIRAKIWTISEGNDLKVYVLQDVVIYSQDCFMLVMAVVLFGIMMAIFILYYLISLISLIKNMRRMSKILYSDVITGGNNWLYFEKKGNKLLKRRLKNKYYAVIHFKIRKFRSFCTANFTPGAPARTGRNLTIPATNDEFIFTDNDPFVFSFPFDFQAASAFTDIKRSNLDSLFNDDRRNVRFRSRRIRHGGSKKKKPKSAAL